jgi:UDP-GlcNAc3NAcA epimerase
MHIITLVGARPQFVKAAALSAAFRENDIKESIVHSGQHYDYDMSQLFFDQLGIPKPTLHLDVPKAGQEVQLAHIVTHFSKLLRDERPTAVVVYGDTTTTLGGALAAYYTSTPLIHIESGLRSYNMSMPEEMNRRLTDGLSSLLFTPAASTADILARENILHHPNEKPSTDTPHIVPVGDIMLDNLRRASDKQVDFDFELPEHFALVTMHRQGNTDDPARLKAIFESMTEWAEKHDFTYVFPIHPRTAKALSNQSGLDQRIRSSRHWKIIPPVGFNEMVALQQKAGFAVSDSGGLPKEMYFHGKPTMIMRSETEWVELTKLGAAILVEPTLESLEKGFAQVDSSPSFDPSIYGDGTAAIKIVNYLKQIW